MTEFSISSQNKEILHCCRWEPEGAVRGTVVIIHGISEHIGRYDQFARFLTAHGFAVVGGDLPGHGGSVSETAPQGCITGGWKELADAVYQLYKYTKETCLETPCFLLGHSMGSFLARTFLIDHPEAELAGAVLSGTAWQPGALLKAAQTLCRMEARRVGMDGVSQRVYDLAFGAYNKPFAPNHGPFDWLTRDEAAADRYVADPKCGFVPSVGLLWAMMNGLAYNEKKAGLSRMNKALPVFFVSGAEDPVGSAGKGVEKSAAAFRAAGMQQVQLRLWPGGRHEMLNEINRQQVYETLLAWFEGPL